MDSNVINRLKEYCMKHQELMQSGVIKGINSNTNEIVLEKNGVQKNVSMDILENNKFDFDKFEIIPDMIEDDEVETIEEMVEEPQETINVPKTMAELNEAIKNKDKRMYLRVIKAHISRIFNELDKLKGIYPEYFEKN